MYILQQKRKSIKWFNNKERIAGVNVQILCVPMAHYNFFILISIINTDKLNKLIHQTIECYEITHWDKLNKVEPIILTFRSKTTCEY